MRDVNEAMNQTFVLCMIFVGIGILMFFMAISQTVLLAKAGARLTQRVRLMTFAAMLRQECGWFDAEEHSVGILAAYLSGDAANMQTVRMQFLYFFVNFFIRYILKITLPPKHSSGGWFSIKCACAINFDSCSWNYYCIFNFSETIKCVLNILFPYGGHSANRGQVKLKKSSN